MRTAGKAGGSAPDAMMWAGVILHLLRIEIVHHAGAHMRSTNGEARVAGIDEGEIDELFQRLAQRLGRIVAGVVGAERHMGAEKGARVRSRRSRGCRS